MQLAKSALLAAVGLLAVSGALAFDRQLLQAPAMAPSAGAAMAPAPAAGAQQASNGVFTFDAATVTFNNGSVLTLSGLSNNTKYVQYPPTVSAGTFGKAVFFSTQLADKSNKWLGGPQVLLQGVMGGNLTNLIVILNAPVYNAKNGTVTASYAVYNGTDAGLPASGGVANSVLSSVASASTGSSTPTLLTSVTPQAMMANVTAFVDVVSITQFTQKQGVGEKADLIRIPLGYSWPGYFYGPYGK